MVDHGKLSRQIVLPWHQVLRIAWQSVKIRWTRVAITTLSLMLAITFFSYTLMTFDILNAIWPHASDILRHKIILAGYEPLGLSSGHRVFGASAKDIWLLMLAILVCLVGITNAQIMAVTERFREIGTMKCLGALDTFIVKIFLCESLYQGTAGSLAGAFLGIMLALISLAFKLGLKVFFFISVVSMLKNVGVSFIISVILSLLGVLYPCVMAARMEPAIALRHEI